MSLLIRIAILAASALSWQHLENPGVFLLVFIGSIVACLAVQFTFERQ